MGAERLWAVYNVGYNIVRNYLAVITSDFYCNSLAIPPPLAISNFLNGSAHAIELNPLVLIDSLDEISNFAKKEPNIVGSVAESVEYMKELARAIFDVRVDDDERKSEKSDTALATKYESTERLLDTFLEEHYQANIDPMGYDILKSVFEISDPSPQDSSSDGSWTMVGEQRRAKKGRRRSPRNEWQGAASIAKSKKT